MCGGGGSCCCGRGVVVNALTALCWWWRWWFLRCGLWWWWWRCGSGGGRSLMRSKGEGWRAAVEWGVSTCLHWFEYAVRVLFTDFLLCARTVRRRRSLGIVFAGRGPKSSPVKTTQSWRRDGDPILILQPST